MENEPLIKKEEAESIASSSRPQKIWQKTWFKVVLIIIAVLIFFSGTAYALYYFYKVGTSDTAPSTNQTTSPGATTSASQAPTPSIELENYDGGFFSIQKPKGWQVATGGNCATFGLVIKDPAKPENQILYFGEIGPVYLNANQKTIDQDYMNMGGYPIEWLTMPVVNPLNPDNFLKAISAISQTDYIKKYTAIIPQLDNVEIISSNSEVSIVGKGEAKVMRVLFKEGGAVGEGQFYLATSEVLPSSGMPASGIGFGFSFNGISANQKEFRYLEKKLAESLGSFNISQDYVNNCIAQQNKTYDAIMKAGKTLSETSDIIMSTWENKNRSDDIISERRSDVMLGRDRVYNPDTGTVYEVDNGWYEDTYRPSYEKYDMNNLQKLPESNYNLWMASPESANNIH